MTEPKVTKIYKSGKHPTQGWDVMQVIFKDEATGRILNSFVISRDANGTIRRKTDILLDWWEDVTNEDDLQVFHSCFEDRDKALAAEQLAKLDEAFGSH